MTLRNSFAMTIAAITAITAFTPAMPARAAELIPVASFDVNLGGSPTQTGFEPLSSTGTGTQNGVTLTSSAGLDEFRDRLLSGGGGPDITAHPFANVLQDFGFENDGSSKTVSFTLTGLRPSSLHKITIFSYDRTANNGATSDWYENVVAGTPLVSHSNIGADPDSADFTLSLVSDGSGSITIVGDAPSILLFNGMSITEVFVPEPSTALLLGLAVVPVARRARRRSWKNGRASNAA